MSKNEGAEPLIKRLWHGLARFLCSAVVCTLYRVRAYGMKNVPLKGPLLILCTHQSFLDPIFVQSWVLRNFHFVARESLWESRFMAALLNTLFVVPIKQGAGDIAAMRRIIAKLNAGCAVCLFPEGERTWDGKVTEVKAGFKVSVMFGEVIPHKEIERIGDREFARVLTEKLRVMHNELRTRIGRTPIDYAPAEPTQPAPAAVNAIGPEHPNV